MYLVCLTDIRQTLATPLPTSGSEKPPSLSDLLSTMNNSLTNQLKLVLNSLKVGTVRHLIMFVCVRFFFLACFLFMCLFVPLRKVVKNQLISKLLLAPSLAPPNN